jgi:uncharacterized cysteine cluster protein YcgN (CxxCxxCC family)
VSEKFWQTTPLNALNEVQWESLCDNCGRCCLHKLEDEDTLEVHFTDVACQYLDEETCTCPHYKMRHQFVPDCLSIQPDWGAKFKWLPDTCAYRLLFEGKDLPAWHPLVSGEVNSVHLAGISVRGRTFKDNTVKEEDFFEHLITWVKS